MARSIAAGFETLRGNLELTGLQGTTVSARQRNIRDLITGELNTLDDFLTGSYKRDTLIGPLAKADVDIFFVLHPDYYKQFTATALLDKVKRTLQKKYPSTPQISRSGQAVTITFTDFKVDVVAGFNRSGGGYLIANSITNSYLSTDPKKHVDLWTEWNKAKSGRLKPLMKMIKGWNRNNGEFLHSFHLEALVYAIYEKYSVPEWPDAVRYFFSQAATWVSQFTLRDPAGYGDDLGRYLTKNDKDELVSRFATAQKRSADAVEYAANGKVEGAFDRWRLVFGDYFPAYG